MEIYVLKNKKTGKWIALDAASGGYAYDVPTVDRAEKFYSKDRAEKYIAVCSFKDYDNPVFELYRLILSTEQIEQRTGEELENLRSPWG